MTASTPPASLAHNGRIVQLDGLRAIAVLAVFAQHALKAPLWMGVDLFFVLSGFLITGILLERKTRKQSYFGYFYARRARRILPPWLLLMAVSSLLFGFGWAQHWEWYAFFATNIGDALGQSGHDSLNVLWSLAVEEQFYIFWPFVILLVPERALGYVALALIVLVPALRAVATPWFDSFWPIYYLTPFRMDLLAAGALLAVAVRRDADALQPWKPFAVLGVCASLAVLAWLHLHFPRFRAANSPLSNAGLYSVSLVLCTSIVVIALQSKGIVKRVLCNPLLVYIGTISYTIYLIHLSVLHALWPLHDNRYVTAALALAITLVYASITWFAFERRLIHGNASRSRRREDALHAAREASRTSA
ncbi:acyltransferase family protein [Paraburkholderia diazotrophica]|uniref:Peptidoglycan/LPS O-acetylase OafA/YrhL, contains acyltransferase and SGNH-hydrolase domains n=1 Tax=Paraburkholderia diazotrophica TaxID=667676 RepID=A0A1H6QRU8_9BURK|nr:acyltransferase [Paraburkholderia diazotrophica]SEI46339.1 Peptidoglycan/LPS O-acetylase OafA/YrhL, contains acyltransferase and SGNH-hydrolase domains [Paraburkholderia diazotrophica]